MKMLLVDLTLFFNSSLSVLSTFLKLAKFLSLSSLFSNIIFIVTVVRQMITVTDSGTEGLILNCVFM